ncbi:porin [Chitinasiproducens palmae]|uniref:Outer membrane protein (Porin) n=1 Tax=Chitinasiproducens palmae TaxID=1770053 RepID=A0A1H2PMK3_9BURK|nr:porin [Chitinasiproducens palmae]SDV47736.1 Outer membrane protein (porin) [Chitinasiproducens palmae]
MKKTLTALAILSTFASAAQAQSSVTLYGIIDAGITYSNLQQTGDTVGRASKAFQMTSGNLYGSRWGLKGTEDLGGGTSALFALENGFNIYNGNFGQGGQMFGRQAYVGLTNERFGTLTLGRQYDSFSDFVGLYTVSNDWATAFGAHFGDIDNLNQSIRINNAIKYVSPSYAGFSFGGLFSLGGVAGDFSRNRAWSLAASYANGPLSIGAGYLNIHNPLTATGTGAYAPVTGNYEGSLPSNYANLQVASSMRAFGAGASYTWGPATFNVVWTRTKLVDSQYFVLESGGPSSDVRFDNYEVGAKYAVTGAWTVGASYTYTDGKADYLSLKPRFHQINLGTNYAISKRTSFYLVGTYQKAAGDGLAFNGTNAYVPLAATAALGAASGTDRQVTVTAGIKHAF